jgi:hypothetical protein
VSGSTHTPGPWHTIPKPSRLCDGLIPIGTTGETLLLSETRHGNGEANALLAAAAPELLEALEALLVHLEDTGVDLNDCEDECRAAIAKARGEGSYV